MDVWSETDWQASCSTRGCNLSGTGGDEPLSTRCDIPLRWIGSVRVELRRRVNVSSPEANNPNSIGFPVTARTLKCTRIVSVMCNDAQHPQYGRVNDI